MVQRVGGARRRVDNTVRELLLQEHRRRFGPKSRWYRPGAGPSDYEQALVAGEPVVVSSSTLMCALLHAGLPSDDYGFGGRHWGKQFMLDVDGTLTEWTPEDAEA
jgi:hypothetical protein